MAERKNQEMVYGVHPLQQALALGKRECYKIVIEKGNPPNRLGPLLKLAEQHHTRLEKLPKEVFRKKYGKLNHQGVVGYFSPIRTLSLEDLMDQAYQATPHPALVLADGIQDPQNLGAIIRSAGVLGLQGLVLPRHRSVPLNETVAKCAAGALESLPIAWVTNLSRAADQLKERGFWVAGLDMAGDRPCYEFDFKTPVAVIIGGEEKGVRPLLKKNCDFTLAIPMTGSLGSLNASAAAAIVFYEIKRQREQPGSAGKRQ
ncbi:MAG: 23S rRNA (guanosine(2251)-2'-O)-methyltransferase RlmB [Nitrospinaceae bacterium]|nr:23S rRNA (guanosine(2251)-2'-O)-methyltransferase RlmB [Nitrospinaceae bacterium]NIR55990.1 23S rRNA (guanosine(2251)-2'-O)-methyltransferase RlmB [Nitrospinaceae bacterium]NIS86433.1 23S rRNA (guanosine(2251)-2'-O)-methyltransferase RlmB [Nitrospinaceae bacterium]NIT83271.1 23S rRNA (guanosine(2251)-2'-O)-methyltransferase RlmB [Nitrospinaceae bacterium]NIU45478.1 23S rRNA (guanosine(2251)-2'-O)-methyltransferase RlmB [Nitrospinaceae bacterium]